MEFFRNIPRMVLPAEAEFGEGWEMVRKLIALIVGLAVALILVSVIQKLGHNLYPPPTDMELADQAFMQDYIINLPWGPLSFVLASYIIATLVGGWLAAHIAGEAPLVIAGIVGLMMMAGAIATMMTTPHPTWFATAAITGIIAATLVAAKLGAGSALIGKVY